MNAPEKECDLCSGTGDAPIFDQHGKHRYDVRCPECWGSGVNPEWEEAEDAEAEERHRERCEAAWAIIQSNARRSMHA